eukprot:gene2546-347_t
MLLRAPPLLLLVTGAAAGRPGAEANYACRSQNTSALPFCDTALAFAARVADLVGRLTNDEKAALLSGRSSAAVPRLG